MLDDSTAGSGPDAGARQRIYDVAVALFAHKGYGAVGVREIARAAGVNLSMVSYYYGGKAGLMRAIIQEAHAKYAESIVTAIDEKASVEQNVRSLVRAILRFFRENTELGLVAFDIYPPVDDADTLAIRRRTGEEVGRRLQPFFQSLGLDIGNVAQMAVVRRMLPSLVISLVEGMYVARHLGKLQDLSKAFQLDDTFFEDCAEQLTEMFLRGVTGIAEKNRTEVKPV